jgi:hypothetical protein
MTLIIASCHVTRACTVLALPAPPPPQHSTMKITGTSMTGLGLSLVLLCCCLGTTARAEPSCTFDMVGNRQTRVSTSRSTSRRPPVPTARPIAPTRPTHARRLTTAKKKGPSERSASLQRLRLLRRRRVGRTVLDQGRLQQRPDPRTKPDYGPLWIGGRHLEVVRTADRRVRRVVG